MKLKFCGFQTKQDILNAQQLNIDALGMVYYDKSKRHI